MRRPKNLTVPFGMQPLDETARKGQANVHPPSVKSKTSDASERGKSDPLHANPDPLHSMMKETQKKRPVPPKKPRVQHRTQLGIPALRPAAPPKSRDDATPVALIVEPDSEVSASESASSETSGVAISAALEDALDGFDGTSEAAAEPVMLETSSTDDDAGAASPMTETANPLQATVLMGAPPELPSDDAEATKTADTVLDGTPPALSPDAAEATETEAPQPAQKAALAATAVMPAPTVPALDAPTLQSTETPTLPPTQVPAVAPSASAPRRRGKRVALAFFALVFAAGLVVAGVRFGPMVWGRHLRPIVTMVVARISAAVEKVRGVPPAVETRTASPVAPARQPAKPAEIPVASLPEAQAETTVPAPASDPVPMETVPAPAPAPTVTVPAPAPDPAPTKVSSEAPAAETSPSEDTVHIKLVGMPYDAEIRVNGAASSRAFDIPRGDKAVKIEVHHPGYETVVKRVVPGRDKTIRVRMEKAE